MNDTNGKSNRRYYVIIIGLILLGATVFAVNKYISPDVVTLLKKTEHELNQTKIKLNQAQQVINTTGQQVNITKDAVLNLTFNQNVSFQNQKVLAKGINSLGTIIIPEIRDIKDKTNLIDDIKFGVDQVLNKTEIKNVTLTNVTNETAP